MAETPDTKPIKPPPPAGATVVATIEGAKAQLNEIEKREILSITEDEAMKQFLAAKLGDRLDPRALTANSVFSGWLATRIHAIPMLMTLHFDNIERARRAADFCESELAAIPKPTEPISADAVIELGETRNSLIKLRLLAIRELGLLLKNALLVARCLRMGEPEPDKPRNKPPDVLNQTNVLVQTAGAGDRVVVSETNRT